MQKFLISLFGINQMLYAAGGDPHHFPTLPLLFHLFNLSVFIFIIYKFAGKQISSMFKKRSDDMEKELKETETEMKRISSEITNYKNLVANFENEKALMRQDSEKLMQQNFFNLKTNFNEEEKRLNDELKKSKMAETLKQEKILKETLVSQILQMSKNELIVKAKSKDIHFNLRQELQENLKNDRL